MVEEGYLPTHLPTYMYTYPLVSTYLHMNRTLRPLDIDAIPDRSRQSVNFLGDGRERIALHLLIYLPTLSIYLGHCVPWILMLY